MSEMKAIADIYSELAGNAYMLRDVLPLGYGAGLPMLKMMDGKLCLQVLYWKCVVTGEKNKNLIYPARYVLSFSLPELKVVESLDLIKAEKFKAVEFDKPVGIFPHEALRGLNKKQYIELRKGLYKALDMLVQNELDGIKDEVVEQEVAKAFTRLLEPSLKPIYQLLNSQFIAKYYRN